MPRFVAWIWRVCAIHYVIGMAVYLHFLVTGSYRYLNWYFLVLGTMFFLLATAAEFYLAFECRAGFEADEPCEWRGPLLPWPRWPVLWARL
jgi:hypothetical protein